MKGAATLSPLAVRILHELRKGPCEQEILRDRFTVASKNRWDEVIRELSVKGFVTLVPSGHGHRSLRLVGDRRRVDTVWKARDPRRRTVSFGSLKWQA